MNTIELTDEELDWLIWCVDCKKWQVVAENSPTVLQIEQIQDLKLRKKKIKEFEKNEGGTLTKLESILSKLQKQNGK